MRSKKYFLNLALFPGFFLLLWGCIEYTITTQVMPDGRILRYVTVKGDSTVIFHGSFRVPADSGWALSTHYEKAVDKDSANDSVYVYEARKEFSDYRELNSYFFRDSVFSDHTITGLRLTKKSKGFFTHYEYTETYSRLFAFGTTSIQDYMTDSEVRAYLSDEEKIYYSPEKDSLMVLADSVDLPVLTASDSSRFRQLTEELEQKFESWYKISIYSDLYKVVSQALDKMGRSADTLNARDRFYHWLDSTNVLALSVKNSEAYVQAAGSFFKVDPAAMVESNRLEFEGFSRKLRLTDIVPESYSNRVLMPGIIVHANTGGITGNLAVWNFQIGDFYASDYVMTVHSRMVNKMAVVIAAIGLVMLIGILLIRMFRK